MTYKWFRTTLLGFLAMVLIQCSPIDVTQTDNRLITATNDLQILEMQADSAASGQSNTEHDTQVTPFVSSTTDPGLQSLIELAKDDLAQRLSISLTQISLVEAKEVIWPDASLGCPQPGMAYQQVPHDGAQIILQVDGINYDYHNGGSRGLFLCEMVTKDPNPPPKLDIFNLTPASADKKNSTPAAPDNSIPPGEDQ